MLRVLGSQPVLVVVLPLRVHVPALREVSSDQRAIEPACPSVPASVGNRPSSDSPQTYLGKYSAQSALTRGARKSGAHQRTSGRPSGLARRTWSCPSPFSVQSSEAEFPSEANLRTEDPGDIRPLTLIRHVAISRSRPHRDPPANTRSSRPERESVEMGRHLILHARMKRGRRKGRELHRNGPRRSEVGAAFQQARAASLSSAR